MDRPKDEPTHEANYHGAWHTCQVVAEVPAGTKVLFMEDNTTWVIKNDNLATDLRKLDHRADDEPDRNDRAGESEAETLAVEAHAAEVVAAQAAAAEVAQAVAEAQAAAAAAQETEAVDRLTLESPPPPRKRPRIDQDAETSPSSQLSMAAPEEFIPAAETGNDATVASALRNPLVDPNMTNQHGDTALILAANRGRAPVVTLLLADKRVDPGVADRDGFTAAVRSLFDLNT